VIDQPLINALFVEGMATDWQLLQLLIILVICQTDCTSTAKQTRNIFSPEKIVKQMIAHQPNAPLTLILSLLL
jgi:hypothetical protein